MDIIRKDLYCKKKMYLPHFTETAEAPAADALAGAAVKPVLSSRTLRSCISRSSDVTRKIGGRCTPCR